MVTFTVGVSTLVTHINFLLIKHIREMGKPKINKF